MQLRVPENSACSTVPTRYCRSQKQWQEFNGNGHSVLISKVEIKGKGIEQHCLIIIFAYFLVVLTCVTPPTTTIQSHGRPYSSAHTANRRGKPKMASAIMTHHDQLKVVPLKFQSYTHGGRLIKPF
jgi:hypothetical protein